MFDQSTANVFIGLLLIVFVMFGLVPVLQNFFDPKPPPPPPPRTTTPPLMTLVPTLDPVAHLDLVFKTNKIVPDIRVGDDEPPVDFEGYLTPPYVLKISPTRRLTVDYPGANVTLAPGGDLGQVVAQGRPEVSWQGCDEGQHYLVLMVDPDAPSPASPVYHNYLHWLVKDVQGCDLSSGTVLTKYLHPGPPADPGTHRHVFVVLRQPGPLTMSSPPSRQGVKVDKLMSDHNLQLVAANFFTTTSDT